MSVLKQRLLALGGTMTSWTVMSEDCDPYRMDTPAKHLAGAWVRDTMDRLGITESVYAARRAGDGDEGIHVRGLHYAFYGEPMPRINGRVRKYGNRNYKWLKDKASKAARWLEYVPFDMIVDERNDDPVVREWTPPDPPSPYVRNPAMPEEFNIDLPGYDDLFAEAGVYDFVETQPYHLVFFGEKTSLRPVLAPLAVEYEADLYLAAGDQSNYLIYRCAQHAVKDLRPMVVLYFADADPSGWNMPVSVARKLTGFGDIEFPGLRFQVVRVGLTPTQAKGLPESVQPEKEKRAGAWRAATGIEQVEIDALATRRPEVLEGIAREAVSHYYDDTLADRVAAVRNRWIAGAQAVLDENDTLADVRASASDRLSDIGREMTRLATEAKALVDSMRVDPSTVGFPDLPEPPEAEIDRAAQPRPLCDSRWSFRLQTERLIASTQYRDVR